MLSIQGSSDAMERLRKDFDDKYMSLLETEREVPNMPFIEKVVNEYGLSVTVGQQTFSPDSNCAPFCKLEPFYFGGDEDDEDDY